MQDRSAPLLRLEQERRTLTYNNVRRGVKYITWAMMQSTLHSIFAVSAAIVGPIVALTVAGLQIHLLVNTSHDSIWLAILYLIGNVCYILCLLLTLILEHFCHTKCAKANCFGLLPRFLFGCVFAFRVFIGLVCSLLQHSWIDTTITLVIVILEAVFTVLTMPLIVNIGYAYVLICIDRCNHLYMDLALSLPDPETSPSDSYICALCLQGKAQRVQRRYLHLDCLQRLVEQGNVSRLLGFLRIQQQENGNVLLCGDSMWQFRFSRQFVDPRFYFVGFTHKSQLYAVDCLKNDIVISNPCNEYLHAIMSGNARVVSHAVAFPGLCAYQKNRRDRHWYLATMLSLKAQQVCCSMPSLCVSNRWLINVVIRGRLHQQMLFRLELVDMLDLEAAPRTWEGSLTTCTHRYSNEQPGTIQVMSEVYIDVIDVLRASG